MKLTSRSLVVLSAAMCIAGSAFSQSYPHKPITLLVGFPPGGTSDVIARLLAPRLSLRLGQPVMVENRPGASGNIAAEFVARSRPDGYTLLVTNTILTINTALGVRQSFDTLKDFNYIAAVASTPVAIGVHPSVPAKTLAELAAYARQQEGRLTYSSCGNGSSQHFAGAWFAEVAKASMVHVPYKGCAPAIVDGIGGRVPVLFNVVPVMAPHVRAGKLRFVAVASQERLSFMPDLPTMSETKGFEGFDAEIWFGVIGPAGMPAEVAERLEREVHTAMQDEKLQKEFSDQHISIRVRNSKQFRKDIAQELATWKRLSHDLGVKLD